ncbi:acylphosphatase, partial [Staphylococcus aureus]|nr:acylphosphatase [Staphylococcus aureus]
NVTSHQLEELELNQKLSDFRSI